MPSKLRVSKDIRARIPVLHHEYGYSVHKICVLLGIKKTFTYRTLQLHRSFGITVESRQMGRRRTLTTTDISFILALLNHHHTVYLDEIQEALWLRRGVKASTPNLTRTLRRLQFTHKDVSSKALERSDRHRAIYMNRIADIVTDPNQLMFGDEASKDERTSNRRKGWSRRGVRCVQRKCFVRGNRYSLLPIITLDGIVTHDIIRGSVTSERFVEFLRELVVSLDCSSTSLSTYCL
jgi:transposase